MDQPVNRRIGHNSRDVTLRVDVRFFNSLSRYVEGQGLVLELELPAGSTVADLVGRFRIPPKDLFLVLVNGRDISPGVVGAPVKDYHVLENGDRVALSGAVPYSFGYGAPVV